MWAWSDVLQHPRQLPVCRHALSYHLPAGLPPWVRGGPAGRGTRGRHTSTGLFLHLAHAWTPTSRKAPRGQGILPCQTSWARATCWHTQQTCIPGREELGSMPLHGVCSLGQIMHPPLYKHNLRQKVPPNIEIREISQTSGFIKRHQDLRTSGRLLECVCSRPY